MRYFRCLIFCGGVFLSLAANSKDPARELDPFVILNIAPTDDTKVIQKAFREKLRELHPIVDHPPADDASDEVKTRYKEAREELAALISANEQLKKPEQRKEYFRKKELESLQRELSAFRNQQKYSPEETQKFNELTLRIIKGGFWFETFDRILRFTNYPSLSEQTLSEICLNDDFLMNNHSFEILRRAPELPSEFVKNATQKMQFKNTSLVKVGTNPWAMRFRLMEIFSNREEQFDQGLVEDMAMRLRESDKFNAKFKRPLSDFEKERNAEMLRKGGLAAFFLEISNENDDEFNGTGTKADVLAGLIAKQKHWSDSTFESALHYAISARDFGILLSRIDENFEARIFRFIEKEPAKKEAVLKGVSNLVMRFGSNRFVSDRFKDLLKSRRLMLDLAPYIKGNRAPFYYSMLVDHINGSDPIDVEMLRMIPDFIQSTSSESYDKHDAKWFTYLKPEAQAVALGDLEFNSKLVDFSSKRPFLTDDLSSVLVMMKNLKGVDAEKLAKFLQQKAARLEEREKSLKNSMEYDEYVDSYRRSREELALVREENANVSAVIKGLDASLVAGHAASYREQPIIKRKRYFVTSKVGSACIRALDYVRRVLP